MPWLTDQSKPEEGFNRLTTSLELKITLVSHNSGENAHEDIWLSKGDLSSFGSKRSNCLEGIWWKKLIFPARCYFFLLSHPPPFGCELGFHGLTDCSTPVFSPGPLHHASLVTMPVGGELGNIRWFKITHVWVSGGGSACLGAAQQLMEVQKQKGEELMRYLKITWVFCIFAILTASMLSFSFSRASNLSFSKLVQRLRSSSIRFSATAFSLRASSASLVAAINLQ